MTSPRPASSRHSHLVALDYELAREQAGALGRLGRALEAALAALAAHDAAHDDTARDDARRGAADGAAGPTRARLVQEASHALWCFLIQRECCGLRDPRPVMRDYRVPAEVQNRVGVVAARPRPSS